MKLNKMVQFMILNAIGLILIVGVIPVYASDIRDEQLSFHWAANDGSFYYHCNHVLVDKELQNWSVQCHDRRFLVHFVIKEILRPSQPNKTVEVLYYIDGSQHSSQGVWLHLEKDSPLYGVVFHQSVDNDASDLVLNFTK